MPRRNRPGGFTVFQPTIRPNVFSPVGVEDVIERQGESALWFRMQPCPCPPEKRLAECSVCIDGHIKSFQETLLQENEKVLCDGHYFYTRFGPVTRVVSTEWLGAGEGKSLDVKRIEPNRVQVSELLETWHAVVAAYEVSLQETVTFKDLPVENSHRIEIPTDGIVIGVESLWLDGEEIPCTGFGIRHVTVPERITGKLNAVLRIFQPIKVAYRTMNVKDGKTERAAITAETGDIEIIVPSGYLMGHGDILTFLTTTVRAAQYIGFKEGMSDRVSFGPVVELINCYSKYTDAKGIDRIKKHKIGEDLILESSERVRWLQNKPKDGYTIMYKYHPSFRIQAEATIAGTMDRNLPRQYRAKAMSGFS